MKTTGGLKGLALLVLVFLTSQQAFARGGVGRTASGLKNPNSLDGLCTQENSSRNWVAKGYCKTLHESMSQGCAGQKLESIRSKAAQGQIEGLQDYCPNGQAMAQDKDKFTQFMMQLTAALTIEESDWSERVGVSSMGAKGLMQLSYSSVKQKAYNCGCSSIKSDADVSRDHHKNLRCGSYIVLHWIDKDKVIGKGGGNKGSRGAARYFQPFRDIDKKKRERIKQKLSNYCKQRESGQAQPVAGSSGAAPAANQ